MATPCHRHPGDRRPSTHHHPGRAGPRGSLGLRDTLGLWGNLGISLLLPVAAAFVVLPGRPLWVRSLAIVVGAVIGSVLLGLGAAAGAREGVPTMVLLRGLLGRRVSYLPTVLNLIQCVGWATFEIGSSPRRRRAALDAPRWPFLLGAGVLATLMALRPLGSVRVLARYAVWAALACVVYLFVEVLSQPAAAGHRRAAPARSGPPSTSSSRCRCPGSRWWPTTPGTCGGAGPRSPAPRSATARPRSPSSPSACSPSPRTARPGSTSSARCWPCRWAPSRIVVLLVVEVDEAFANIYSTAVSAQNLAAPARPAGAGA